ncbi:MAG TPA: universal stress protein [Polyangiaceae bacterium]|nr:universal stress protein [Polyangiaceae bacterium]
MSIFQKILVPVDFSVHSSFALRTAADLARRFNGSITILHVHDPLPYALPGDLQPISKEQHGQLRAEIEKELAALRVRAETGGASSVETLVTEGPPAEEIVRCAERGAFDLIVIGTHGRRGFQRMLLGSVAERVTRLAACPVLSIRAPEEELGKEKLWPPKP